MKSSSRYFMISGVIFSLIFFVFCKPDISGKDILTQEERAWLEKHPNIKIAVCTTFPPFQFTDKKSTSKGLSVDIMNLVEEKINFEFEKVYFDNWQDILQAGEKRQVDVILEIQENKERRQYLSFTQPFIEVPHAIIMRKTFNKEISLSKMKGMKIAVVNNYAIHDFLKRQYPDLTLVPLLDDVSCLRAVSLQKADAMVSSQALAVYFIQQEAISNLHIVGNAKYNNVLAFAVRKDWPVLTRIIDKGLARISNREQKNIFDQWLQLSPISFWKQSKFWIFISFLASSCILIIVVISLWTQTLKRKVKIRTHQLQIAKDNAEESNRLKSSFLANMSHEIRTPLNAIQGFSELLNQNDLNPEKKMKYTRIIDANCKSLIHLINEILDFSKIEAGQITIHKKDVNIINIAQEVVNTNYATLEHKPDVKLELKNDLGPTDTTIHTDPLRLEQVLNNLISNAIKFTHSGKITLGLSSLNRQEYLLYVRDTGIGMDNNSIKVIFDRYTKVEKDTTTLHRGSGLGLHISKKLLELMGGKIWVESEPGKGSTFFFTLPKQQTQIPQ